MHSVPVRFYFVKAEYAPNVIITNEDKPLEILERLVAASHAVVPPQVGLKSFIGMLAMNEFMKVYANNPDYKVFEAGPFGIREISDFDTHI